MHRTITIPFAHVEVAFIGVLVGDVVLTETVNLVILPRTNVDITVSVDHTPVSIGLVLAPVALVDRAIDFCLLAAAVFHAIGPLALVLSVIVHLLDELVLTHEATQGHLVHSIVERLELVAQLLDSLTTFPLSLFNLLLLLFILFRVCNRYKRNTRLLCLFACIRDYYAVFFLWLQGVHLDVLEQTDRPDEKCDNLDGA